MGGTTTFKSKNIKFLVRLYSQLTENENNPDYLYLKNLKVLIFLINHLKMILLKVSFLFFQEQAQDHKL